MSWPFRAMTFTELCTVDHCISIVKPGTLFFEEWQVSQARATQGRLELLDMAGSTPFEGNAPLPSCPNIMRLVI